MWSAFVQDLKRRKKNIQVARIAEILGSQDVMVKRENFRWL